MNANRHSDDRFEERLEKLSPAALDPAWRDEILSTATAQGWSDLAWFLPKPLLLGLAASWILVGILNSALPSNESPPAFTKKDPSPPAIRRGYLEDQQRLLATVSNMHREDWYDE